MRTLGNIIWFVFGGVFMGLLWWFFGLLAFISIIGIPWGRACFVMGNFSFFPFGKEAVSRDELTNEMDDPSANNLTSTYHLIMVSLF